MKTFLGLSIVATFTLILYEIKTCTQHIPGLSDYIFAEDTTNFGYHTCINASDTFTNTNCELLIPILLVDNDTPSQHDEKLICQHNQDKTIVLIRIFDTPETIRRTTNGGVLSQRRHDIDVYSLFCSILANTPI